MIHGENAWRQPHRGEMKVFRVSSMHSIYVQWHNERDPMVRLADVVEVIIGKVEQPAGEHE